MSTAKTIDGQYRSAIDHKTPTPGVYRRSNYYRVLVREGKRKIMHRFETYEEAVEFKRRRGRQPSAGRRAKPTYRNKGVAYLLADPCAYCGAPSTQQDHIDPIALGGSNDWSNLSGACAPCNRSKGISSLLEFLLRSGAPAKNPLDAVALDSLHPLHDLLGN